ncbi:MAG: hypothetical protein MJA27_03730 [Pseudanabaenales cyanobacterium]|nr:hypothetical protein [Pseudanabaenales cyanobacterium]
MGSTCETQRGQELLGIAITRPNLRFSFIHPTACQGPGFLRNPVPGAEPQCDRIQ